MKLTETEIPALNHALDDEYRAWATEASLPQPARPRNPPMTSVLQHALLRRRPGPG